MIKLKMLFRLFKLLFYLYIIFHFYLKYAYADRILGQKSPNPNAAVTLGIIFDKDSDEVQHAFKTAMMLYKSRQAPMEFQIYIDVINTADVFKLSRLICNQYTRGAVAMLGSVPSDSFDTLHSYANTFQMPFITPWFPEKVMPSSGNADYALSLRPDYHRAIVDTIIYYGWTNIIYIYDSHDGLLRLQSIYDNMQPGLTPFRIIKVKRVSKAIEIIDYLAELEGVDRWSYKYIVLDSSTDMAKETVIKHARSFKLGRRSYHYLLSGFVMDDYWNENVHEFETLNITGFRVLDYSTKRVKDFLENWKSGSHISSKAAMMFDTVNLMIEAILRLARKKPEFLRAAAHRSIPPNSTKINHCNIEEIGITPFEFGDKLAKMIRKTEIDGITGLIKFDEEGRRSNFTLRIVEMTSSSKMETVGTWYDGSGLKPLNEHGWVGPSDRNKTYIITSIQEKPYIMPVDNRYKVKYKGFCVDLAEMIMKNLGLKYEFRLVQDGKYGQENPTVPGQWDGIVGELMRKEADMSISSLAVSVQREAVIEFSRTFLSFDSMPDDIPQSLDSIFSFLQPLSKEIWCSIFGGFLAVSLCLYIVSKYSNTEYQLRVNSNGNTQSSSVQPAQATVENTFTLWNAIWFSLGSFMQQTSGYTPRSVSGRIVSGVWWFVALFVIVIYTANLTTHLTISQLNPPLNPLNRVSKCPAETNKPCEMLISVMETGLKDFAVAFPKGSPLREGVNLALQKLRNKGDLYRLIRRWFMPMSCSNTNHGKEMSLSQIAGLFYILLGGLGVGLIIGLIEYMVYRRERALPTNSTPPGTPIREPGSPVMRTIKSNPHRTLREQETIDWNAANYVGYGSPSNHQRQEETAMHGTFRQV